LSSKDEQQEQLTAVTGTNEMDKRSHVRRPRSDAISAAIPVVVPPSLSGVDLVEFIAHNATLQKQRWME
jgi:hypothetical protein